MQKTCFITLLILGLASGCSVYAQASRYLSLLRAWHAEKGGIVLPTMDSVRIMAPDRMPCLVPDLARLEKMPVRKLQNRHPHDPMPNAIPDIILHALGVPRPQKTPVP